MFKKISIIGVGLIGGSIALQSKRKRLAKEIWGFFRNKERLEKALRLKVIDKASLNLGEVIKDSDFVILSLPVLKIIEYLDKIKDFLKKDTIITDVGSTKKEILKEAKKKLKGFNFVASHPFTGSEKRGFENSEEVKWENSICFVCTDSVCTKQAYRKVKIFWKKLGAQIIEIDSGYHDKLVGAVSHLPHLISYSLINSLDANFLKIAPQSFKSLTRIAGSPESVWSDIFFTNRKNILYFLDKFLKELLVFKKTLEIQDALKIKKIIKKANRKRFIYIK